MAEVSRGCHSTLDFSGFEASRVLWLVLRLARGSSEHQHMYAPHSCVGVFLPLFVFQFARERSSVCFFGCVHVMLLVSVLKFREAFSCVCLGLSVPFT